jgi:hypothetical protein
VKAKDIFKRFISVALAGAAAIVFAMPITAMAHDHDGDHDRGRHLGWSHRDWNHDRDWDHDRDHCNFRPAPRAYYQPRPYYQPQPYYTNQYYAPPVGFSGGPQMNNLQQQWMQAKSRHQQAVASGNRYRAKVTADHLYKLDRRMGVANNGQYNGYSGNSYYDNGYNDNGYYNNYQYQNGSVLGPILGNMLGY